MTKKDVGAEEDNKKIHEIVHFAMFRLRQNGQVLLDTFDGWLFSFFEDESLEDEVHNWCVVKVSLCTAHGASIETRGPALSALGFRQISSTTTALEFEAEVRFDDCYSTLYTLLLVGFDAGETQLNSIEMISVNSEREVFGVEKYQFLSNSSEGGDEK